MNDTKIQEISELLMQTGKAHHKAFIKTDGADPEWALWYAEQLKEQLPTLLGKEMTKSRIVYEFVRMEETSDTTQDHWTKVYAKELLSKYTGS